MYCRKCGTELRQDAVFCEKCGNKVAALTQKVNKKEGGKSKGIYLLSLIALGALAVLLIVIALPKKTIDMNDYINITFKGYDTVGQAYVDFDHYAFLEDYADKLKYKSKEVHEEAWMSPCEMIESYADGELDKSSDLSNGDETHYYWEDMEYAGLPEFNYKLNFETIDITVEGLEELREVDLFEDVEIILSGYAPYAYTDIVNHSKDEAVSNLGYKLSKERNIDIGDTLTLTLNYSDDYTEEEVAKKIAAYGIKAKALSKEIPIETCNEYVRKLEDVPAELMEQMKAETEKVINEMPADWSKYVSIENVTNLGSYLFWVGDTTWNNYNHLYLIYKITIREYMPDLGVDNTIDVYYASDYRDIATLADGTYTSPVLIVE